MPTKQRKKKIDGWYIRKLYPHIDRPLTLASATTVVHDQLAVARHSFLPFIEFLDVKRRFTPKAAAKSKDKIRRLAKSSHLDGYIFSFYATKLSEYYEAYLDSKSFSNCVIGYRAGIGTNIHMAKAAFCEIRNRGVCSAVAIDISDFFGSIDHQLLLKNLQTVVGTKHSVR